MSNLSKLFQKQPVEIPNRSGFDMSHLNVGTMKVGTLVPVLCEPVYPNDKLSLGIAASVQLPPMAADFIGKVDLRLESFFVPNRIVWHGWQKFYNRFNVDQYSTVVDRLPKIKLDPNVCDILSILGPGSLGDYLGFKCTNDRVYEDMEYVEINNPLPWLAYHMIYDRWYRDKVIQRPLFATKDEIENMITNGALGDVSTTYIGDYYPAMMPYLYSGTGLNGELLADNTSNGWEASEQNYSFADNSNLFQLRQRNWAKDYFTVGTPQPQAGDPISLEFSVADSTGSFSIKALRAANSLQKFAERRNIAGSEYQSQIHADWGIVPSDAILQHPIYLGGQTVNVYNRAVTQTANGAPSGRAADGAITSNDRNPFASTVGASFGKSQGIGSGSLFDDFHATEHGYLFVLASLVPHAFYGTGTRRHLMYHEFGDFPIPALSGVGDQPIFVGELSDTTTDGTIFNDSTFAYTGRYSEAKFIPDSVHGKLRDGSDLEHFAVQRCFNDDSQISSDFLEIKTTAMDNVSAVESTISGFGAWYEMGIQLHKSAVLPAYAIPTLGDEKDTHTVMVDKGGKRL